MAKYNNKLVLPISLSSEKILLKIFRKFLEKFGKNSLQPLAVRNHPFSKKSKVHEKFINNLNKILFEQPLKTFPSYFVVEYISCIVIYVALSAVYYRVFHPWKIIIWEKKSNELVQEVPLECIPPQHNDKPLSYTETTHL